MASCAGRSDKVKKSVEVAGKAFDKELNNLYVSGPIAKALLACDKNYASTEARRARRSGRAIRRWRATLLPKSSSPPSKMHSAHGRDGRTPCTLLVLDEVQQYIGDSNDRSVLVTEVAEAVSKQLDSQVEPWWVQAECAHRGDTA